MGSSEVINCERRIIGDALHARRIAPDHSDFDFTGVAEGGAWDFRSTELENRVERKRRTVLTRRCGVGKISRRAYRRQTSAVVPADSGVALGSTGCQSVAFARWPNAICA